MEPDSPVRMMPHEKKAELAQLKSTIQNAVAQRGRYYAEVFSFSVYFEADDTSAFRDTEHFQNILKMLELPAATELVIKANDRNPAGTFQKFIYELDIKAQDTDNKYLILGHYAGHAGLSVDGTSLVFYDTLSKRQRMTLKRTFEPLYDVNEGNFENTDVVIILDSCYSAQATRGSKNPGRSVEIVASVGVDQQALGNASRLARIQNKTFTSRLADEVARRIGRQDTTSISFSEIVEDLGRLSLPHRIPEYNLKVGGVGIRLPIPMSAKLPPHLRILSQRHRKSSSESSIDVPDTNAPSSDYFACFKVHLTTTDPDSPEMMKLVQWIYSLNPNIGLELTGVFLSNSTHMFFSAPGQIWAQLSQRSGFSLICKVSGPNMLPTILSNLATEKAITNGHAPLPSRLEDLRSWLRQNQQDENITGPVSEEESCSGEVGEVDREIVLC